MRIKLLFILLCLLIIRHTPAFGVGETVVTESAHHFQPHYLSEVDFVAEFGHLSLPLEGLGEKIDEALQLSNVEGLVNAALLLGIQEKLTGRRSSHTSAARLLDTAMKIASTFNNRNDLLSVYEIYNDKRTSVYDEDKSLEIKNLLERLDRGEITPPLTGTIVVYNNRDYDEIFVYVNGVFRCKVESRGMERISGIETGRVLIMATNNRNYRWGPRKVFLGKDEQFHWKLY